MEVNMGRTLSTYTDLVLSLQEQLAKFRRALRKDEQELFDRLIAFALKHTGKGTYSSALNPVEMMLLSMILEQQKQIAGLRRDGVSAQPNFEQADAAAEILQNRNNVPST